MDIAASSAHNPTNSNESAAKRKRSPSNSAQDHNPPKTQKIVNNAHLAINYLARQYEQDLPLISNEDTLPQIIQLINEYHGVLERHESMACNLGARPLGPILIKRFERLFDGPPKVLKNHGKDGNVVTWLDVVEFARNKPEQFTLGQMSEGLRVCQFYTKQCRMQISEEDYLLISSGMPQKLIPPQPIVEDEEKELGTLEILEKNLSSICHAADQVAARTRQLRHRINGRKQAILERRANEPGQMTRGTSPSVLIGSQAGFVAVNARQGTDHSGSAPELSKNGASTSTRNELMSKFFTQAEKDRRDAERSAFLNGEGSRASTAGAPMPSITSPSYHRPTSTGPPRRTVSPLREIHPREEQYDSRYGYQSGPQQSRPAQHERDQIHSAHHMPHPEIRPPNPNGTAPGTPQAPKEKEFDGPFKSEMVALMESLKRGDRVLPPCDRCRRLHMDCIKNLTACQGCTKKHAKCSWRDVRESELFGPDAHKVPIHSENDGEREPSVGYRPEEMEYTHSHSPHSTTPSNVPNPARINATEGLAAHSTSSQTTSDSEEIRRLVHSYTEPQSHTYQPSVVQATHETLRHDSGRPISPNIDHTSHALSHVQKAAATSAAAVNHTENGFRERKDESYHVAA